MILFSDNYKELRTLLSRLGGIRGRHTELVSVYVPSGYELAKIAEQIRQEQSTAQNIKSKAVRKNVVGALERILQHLKLFRETPSHGLVLFAGNIAEKEGVSDIELWSIEPPEPIRQKLYWCGQTFILDPLQDLVREREIYGLLVLDKSEATLGLLKGKKIELLKHMESIVPGKTKAGGWCVHQDSLIQLQDGRIRKIKDLGREPFLCYDFSNLKLTAQPHNHYFSRSSDQALEIRTTAPSFRIHVTPEHLFFIAGKNGFETKPVGELDTTDRLLLTRKMNVTGKQTKLSIKIPKNHTLLKRGRIVLREERKRLRLSQGQVAQKLGVSQTALSKFENGERSLKQENLEKLLRIYRLEKKRFFDQYIKIEDRILFPHILTGDLAQVFGYLLGDGNREPQRIAISEADEQLVRLYKKKIEKLFKVTTSLKKRTNKGYWQLRLNSVPLLTVIQNYFSGILNPKNREIPDVVCQSANTELAGFIRGLFDAEGYVVSSNKSVGITMNSCEVIEALQLLLLRFGIFASLKPVKQKGSYAKQLRYALTITDWQSLQNYKKEIGFSSKKKDRVLKSIVSSSGLTKTDQIPVRGSYLLRLVQQIGLTTEYFPHTGTVFFGNKKGMSYTIFQKRIIPVVDRRIRELEQKEENVRKLRAILRIPYNQIAKDMGVGTSTVFGNIKNGWNVDAIRKVLKKRQQVMFGEAKQLKKLLSTLLDSDLISARIASIKPLTPTGLYYDMEVPVMNNFIANGFVLHNSQARYARIREGLLNDFLKKVGEVVSGQFREVRDLKGIIVGGPGPIKEQFLDGEYLHYEVRKKVLGTVNTSYTGEYGLRETVERAETLIAEASVMHEKQVLDRFFEEFAKDSGLAVYGIHQVLEALAVGNMALLLVSESFDWVRVRLKSACGEARTGLLRTSQIGQQRCAKCGQPFEEREEEDLLEELTGKAGETSTQVEFISTDTQKGEQLKELGGIAGMLRYKVQG